MRLGIFSRLTANALSSFLLAAGLFAQAPASTAPVSAAEKALQVIPFAGVASVDLTTNAPTLFSAPGGPFANGVLPILWGTQSAGTVFGVPLGGGAAVPSPLTTVPQALCKMTSPLEANNTATETTVYSCQVPAGALGTSGNLHVLVNGDFLHNGAGTETMTLAIKFGCPSAAAACAGGQVIYSSASAALGALNARVPFRLTVDLMELAATNSQGGSAMFAVGSQSATSPTAGVGNFVSAPMSNTIFKALGLSTAAGSFTAATVDTTAAQYFIVTWKYSAAHAGLIFTSRSGYSLLIP